MKRWPLACLMLVGLGACAPAPQRSEPPGPLWESRKTVLQATQSWTSSGRIAMAAPDQGFSASFVWRQSPAWLDARLRGPLGSGSVNISGPPQRLVVYPSDGEPFEVYDPEAELEARYGWTLPVDSMRFWLLGAPDPGFAAVEEVAPHGTLSILEQRNWQIRYTAYRDVSGQPLPRRMVMQRGDLRVRLAIRSWRLAGPSEVMGTRP